jgi:hypothetical protein
MILQSVVGLCIGQTGAGNCPETPRDVTKLACFDRQCGLRKGIPQKT